MNKKIKLIDLLCLISVDGEVPKKIKLDETIYYYDENSKFYFDNEGYSLLRHNPEYSYEFITSEAEILEDEVGGLEELDYKYKNMYGNISTHKFSEFEIIDKINELIKAVNHLSKKENK